MREYAERVVGPIMYPYVCWILKEAQIRGICRLYFLARDGYLLRKIADRICDRMGMNIENRYLYCSRKSLRTPAYRLDRDECRRLLFSYGYYCTPRTLLARADIADKDAELILSDLGYEDIDIPLSRGEFDKLCKSLEADGRFIEHAMKLSEEQYPPTIDYLRREGLFDTDTVAIVDSGWSGSMQHSLAMLMRSAGYSGKLVGFYFGMYSDPRAIDDGELLTFYFNADGPIMSKVMFNNNLFECMLSAPHPMTVGYRYNGGNVTALLCDGEEDIPRSLISAQISGALAYTNAKMRENRRNNRAERGYRDYYRLIKRAMIYPTREEAQLYSHFGFCDDISEIYALPVADPSARLRLKPYLLLNRLRHRLRGDNSADSQLLWVYGAIAFLPRVQRIWYRVNALLYDLIKAVKDKFN